MTGPASLLAVEPTVFFTHAEKDSLRQRIYINLDNHGPAGELHVSIRSAGFDERLPLGRVETGTGRYPLSIPELRQPAALVFGLWAGDTRLDQQEVAWQPQRHWQVDLVAAGLAEALADPPKADPA